MIALVVGALALLSAASVAYAFVGLQRASAARRDLNALATHDPLTGLRNRAALGTELGRRLGEGRNPTGGALLVALDDFATVNDLYGHEVGDQLLSAVAAQLTKNIHSGEQLYRLVGPQFLVTTPLTAAAAVERAESLQQNVQVQYRIDHDVVRATASIAVVTFEARHATANAVLDDAESALTAAASEGLGQVTNFDSSMAVRTTGQDPVARLRQAIDAGKLELFYQPVVALSDASLVGVEAILVWNDPQRGRVGGRHIFELIDGTELVDLVGDWVLRRAFEDSRAWADAYPEREVVTTVNVTAPQLGGAGFVNRLSSIIDETGADRERICVEMSEGTRPADVDVLWRVLRDAKDIGVQVGLEDFGTGFSTFEFLRNFELDVLKIDRVFVERIVRTEGDYAIVQQLIGLAHALGLVTIAEGVDRSSQAERLVAADCDLGQGKYWSQPISADEMGHVIAKGIVRPVAGR